MDNDRNLNIIKSIVKHCKNIFLAQKRFGNDIKVFARDMDYFNSVCMSLLQVGELANRLTADFKISHKNIPWHQIIGLRNIVVHRYGQIDTDIVWATLEKDIPVLYKYCRGLAKKKK